MPQAFKDAYPKTRVIIDCTEIYIEMTTSFCSQSATYSSYKIHNTAKWLIGISPAGYPSFISELYAGCTSNKQITKDCGILNMLEPVDDLMADRGFDIEDDMPDGVTLNSSPFLNGAPQSSVSDESETRKIAAVRVHVERVIERIKRFRILKNVLPLSMASELNKIWIVCSYLTLFHAPLKEQCHAVRTPAAHNNNRFGNSRKSLGRYNPPLFRSCIMSSEVRQNMHILQMLYIFFCNAIQV